MIAAGGTGGHLFPAQALAEVLKARGWRVVLATDERAQALSDSFPAEKRIALASATIRGRNPLVIGRALLTILYGVIQARAALTLVDPAIVIGFGGYPSLPALLGALSQGRRTLIHEQNAVSGRANRLIAPHATAVACAFPTLLKARSRVQARAVVVGNPVRPEIRALADLAYEPPTDEIRLLVTGGSQGARLLSELVPAAVAQLPEALRLHAAAGGSTSSPPSPAGVDGDGLSLTFRVGQTLEHIERAAMDATLRHTKGDKSLTAKMLGVSLRTLYRRLGEREDDVE